MEILSKEQAGFPDEICNGKVECKVLQSQAVSKFTLFVSRIFSAENSASDCS